MKKSKNKISIFKRIGLIAIAFCVSIGSFFINLPKNGHSNFASADTTNSYITFNGSNVWVPVSRTTAENTAFVDYLLVDINFSINHLTNTFDFNFNGTTGFYTSNEWSWDGYSYNYFPFTGLYPETSTSLDFNAVFDRELTNQYVAYYYGNDQTSRLGYLLFTIVGSENIINSDIVSVSLGYVDTVNTNNNYQANFIRYTDTNGNFVTFYFRTLTGRANANQLSNRTYYFPSAFDLSDNQLFQQGYHEGLLDNQSTIYDNGYHAGKIDGEAIGYDKGVLEANDYSFTSLFGAVIDAPIKAFSGLFNFEFLGVNLLDFFLGLLTFGVVIFVIKLLLGG